MDRTALYAGSFDPLTLGHEDIIERASALFDRLVVAVVVNPNKNPLFTLEERMEAVRKACAGYDNVDIISYEGLLADLVNEKRYDAVVRGLRVAKDFDYELQMVHANNKLYRYNTETVFLMTRPELSYISSKMVKEVASLGGDISSWVNEEMKISIYNKYGRNQ